MTDEQDEKPRPYTARARRLEQVISSLEGWAFGKSLVFTTIGYGDQLHHSNGGWKPIEYFSEVPGLREFADKLNAAIEPIMKDYATELRDELIKECEQLAQTAKAGP